MALDSDRLGDEMMAAADALDPEAFAADPEAERRRMFRALALAIVREIQENASVDIQLVVGDDYTAATADGPAAVTGKKVVRVE